MSANIHRRHLTKQQQADLIVAAVKAGARPFAKMADREGRAVNPVKAAAVASAKALATQRAHDRARHGQGRGQGAGQAEEAIKGRDC